MFYLKNKCFSDLSSIQCLEFANIVNPDQFTPLAVNDMGANFLGPGWKWMTSELYNKKCHKALVYPLSTSFRGGVGGLLIFEKNWHRFP